MIELLKYFRILFLSKNISRDRLKDFTEDHIQRLTTTNPGGIFTAILTAVTNAYNSYYGDLSSEALNRAVQEGKTIALEESRTALLKQLSDNEKLVAYTYRNNATAYEEFYPLGMEEYNKASISNLESHSNRYKTILGNHSTDFTPAFVTDYNTVQGTYVANRAAQQAAFGAVASERSDLQTTRPELAKQLTTNLLTIALQYIGDESKADVYFNQAILNEAFKESERKVESDIDPGETQLVFDNIIKADLQLQVKNTGGAQLFMGFKTTETEPATVDDFVLTEGLDQRITVADLGWSNTKKYLVITNAKDITGSYLVQKV